MSIALLKKSITIYKPIFLWNILVSLLTAVFFILNGFSQPGIYSFAIFIKLIGWSFSAGIYFMFYQSTAYFFKNQGIGFRKIMLNLVLYDLFFFIGILVASSICRDFLSTVLINFLQTAKY
ncbi:hypothetical protein SAMN04488511_105189 [Pedobacter suwonensis]|uniref:Polysaccharide biosynthesis protein n=1 Tax=Pedobacter suwonensis TaxID=332999 RepID=A0A1I0T2A3_9SPHI|nr:hypothetical protein SAMN04488511_105189 [Pedobacter suwonensis]